MTRIQETKTPALHHPDDDTSASRPPPVSEVHGWADRAQHWVQEKAVALEGQAKSALLSLVDCLPIKADSPVSTAMLKHYVEHSGAPFELQEIPAEWQAWMVSATHGKVGHFRDLNPYNSGLFDLRNSLGHFDVDVTRNPDGTQTYVISDTYQFGFIQHDTEERGRHGFPLGQLSSNELALLRWVLPKEQYDNPGGFRETWEVKTIGRETFLIIPQQVLEKQGKPFAVSGRFTTQRAPLRGHGAT